MAQKTSKDIDKHQEDKQRFQWECLRRKPEFISDVKNFWVSFKRNPIKGLELEHRFFKKYCIFPPSAEDLSNPDRWDIIDSGYDIVAVVPDRQWQKSMPGKTYLEKSKNWEKLLKNKRVELYKHILRNNRFLTLRIDTDRDKTIIERAISKKLRWIIEKKKQFGLGRRLDKTPHLDKSERYFRVYNLRNKMPQMEFEKIALIMLGDGYYKEKSIEKAVNSVKKDYVVAFEEIFGVPYRKWEAKKLNKNKIESCDNCPERKLCEKRGQLCARVEYYLSKEIESGRVGALVKGGVVDIDPEVLNKKRKRYEDEENMNYDKIRSKKQILNKVDQYTERWLRGKDK